MKDLLKGLGVLVCAGIGLTFGGIIGTIVFTIAAFFFFVYNDEWFA